tara:strand:+ start:703 stop:1230 length:528 start_codon:yes stop_codon:yes gene_type:complete
MSLTIQVHNSCGMLTVRSRSYLPVPGASGEIQISNYDTGSVSPLTNPTITFSGGGGYGSLNIDVDNLSDANGLYKICLIEGGVEQVCKPVLISCNVDCCLTDLTNELLACACDCPKCASTLAKAQKIFLLLQSARSAVELAQTADGSVNMGYYKDILNKYKKAVELCDSSCGCDC